MSSKTKRLQLADKARRARVNNRKLREQWEQDRETRRKDAADVYAAKNPKPKV
jgi:hypothetical protein